MSLLVVETSSSLRASTSSLHFGNIPRVTKVALSPRRIWFLLPPSKAFPLNRRLSNLVHAAPDRSLPTAATPNRVPGALGRLWPLNRRLSVSLSFFVSFSLSFFLSFSLSLSLARSRSRSLSFSDSLSLSLPFFFFLSLSFCPVSLCFLRLVERESAKRKFAERCPQVATRVTCEQTQFLGWCPDPLRFQSQLLGWSRQEQPNNAPPAIGRAGENTNSRKAPLAIDTTGKRHHWMSAPLAIAFTGKSTPPASCKLDTAQQLEWTGSMSPKFLSSLRNLGT